MVAMMSFTASNKDELECNISEFYVSSGKFQQIHKVFYVNVMLKVYVLLISINN